MAKVIFRIIVSILVLIGLATIARWVIGQSSVPAPDLMRSINSPRGKFKAVLAWWTGGGAIAPYCYDKVFVGPEYIETDKLLIEENLVFSGTCGSFARKEGKDGNSPELSWREESVLVVKFSTLEAKLRPETFRLRRMAVSGQVEIEFEVDH